MPCSSARVSSRLDCCVASCAHHGARCPRGVHGHLRVLPDGDANDRAGRRSGLRSQRLDIRWLAVVAAQHVPVPARDQPDDAELRVASVVRTVGEHGTTVIRRTYSIRHRTRRSARPTTSTHSARRRASSSPVTRRESSRASTTVDSSGSPVMPTSSWRWPRRSAIRSRQGCPCSVSTAPATTTGSNSNGRSRSATNARCARTRPSHCGYWPTSPQESLSRVNDPTTSVRPLTRSSCCCGCSPATPVPWRVPRRVGPGATALPGAVLERPPQHRAR